MQQLIVSPIVQCPICWECMFPMRPPQAPIMVIFRHSKNDHCANSGKCFRIEVPTITAEEIEYPPSGQADAAQGERS